MDAEASSSLQSSKNDTKLDSNFISLWFEDNLFEEDDLISSNSLHCSSCIQHPTKPT
jgi:hypothetical protein